MDTNHDLVEFFLLHTSLIYYGLQTNPSFGAGLPDFKRTYLRPQEELENVLTIQIEPEFSALSVYEVSGAIPSLLPYQNNDFRGVNEKNPTLHPLKKNYYVKTFQVIYRELKFTVQKKMYLRHVVKMFLIHTEIDWQPLPVSFYQYFTNSKLSWTQNPALPIIKYMRKSSRGMRENF